MNIQNQENVLYRYYNDSHIILYNYDYLFKNYLFLIIMLFLLVFYGVFYYFIFIRIYNKNFRSY